ncbi:MauE/DoxX family redox-associated membrane protein [Pedobacter endophyticus]|uniref:Methylamine utilisation protein MauE domain-containing protein n=1 Tax=Pedobacter endophyticus TaxID=2789740 RepID=A0A7S9Q0D3_9SPHI|nr:MauE/DoxX family redox-associated membrane protein [Pedobacter endophyticus]QPH40552.1 hypothetical protein IZT61_04530 [Pedobacter endophyticus]
MKATAIHQNHIPKASAILLIMLWSSTGLSKILGYTEFTRQLTSILGEQLSLPVSMAVPTVELIAAVTIAFQKTRVLGLYLSLMLLTVFTAYLALVILGYYRTAPCTCGGIITALSWKGHLLVNMILLFLVLYLLLTLKKERSQP